MVSVGAVTAAEQNALARDKACYLTANALRAVNTHAEWSTALDWATGGSGGASNVSLATHPARFVYDGHAHLRTYPSNTASSGYYLLFDLQSAATREADALAIVGHNFDELLGNVTVRFGLADSSDFATNPRIIAEWGPGSFTSQRLVELDLSINGTGGGGDYARFTNVQYGYLLIASTTTMGGANPRPQIGEIFLGRRRQLARKHNYPGDDKAKVSIVDDFEADGGARGRYVKRRGQRDLTLTWTSDEQDTLGLNDIATWEALDVDLEDSTLPFFFLRDPSTTPADCGLFDFPNPGHAIDWIGPRHGDTTKALLEKPPYLSREGL